MFDDILRIFDFLSPSRTREQFQPRKPMAIPLDPTIKSIQICKNLFNDLDEAEAEVVNDIHDPERAWKLLSQIRQLRRETQQDLATLSPSYRINAGFDVYLETSPVRIVNTQTGAQLSVFNGGRHH